MDQQQMYAQQTFQMTPCGFQQPQYLPQIPTIPGYTPMLIGSPYFQPQIMPMLPQMQNMAEFGSTPFLISPEGFLTHPSVSASPSPCFLPPMMVPIPQQNPPANLTIPANQPTASRLQIAAPYVSHSRSLSPDTDSGSDYQQRGRSRSLPGRAIEKSKKELVDAALGELSRDFGSNFDTDGLRGQNILRIKVKTRVALENIVAFIRFCQRENLLECVSCPISTKKGRQHVRGFLAYLQTRNEQDADRVCELFDEYNVMHNNPFKAYQRNPKSTLYKSVGAEA